MKTISISGKGVKSTPVSLSKASKYLSKFVESDSGASEANLGFLKRASAAFKELNAFHKEINKLKSRRQLEEGGDDELREDGRTGGGGREVVVDDGKELSKKERKKQRDLQNDGDGVEADGRKRKKLEDGENRRFEDSEERKLKKKRKKHREDEA